MSLFLSYVVFLHAGESNETPWVRVRLNGWVNVFEALLYFMSTLCLKFNFLMFLIWIVHTFIFRFLFQKMMYCRLQTSYVLREWQFKTICTFKKLTRWQCTWKFITSVTNVYILQCKKEREKKVVAQNVPILTCLVFKVRANTSMSQAFDSDTLFSVHFHTTFIQLKMISVCGGLTTPFLPQFDLSVHTNVCFKKTSKCKSVCYNWVCFVWLKSKICTQNCC